MIRTILVPLDGSAFAEQALAVAGALAARAGARLVLATVHAAEATAPFAAPSPVGETPTGEGAGSLEEYVHDTAAAVAERYGIETIARVLDGPVVESLIHEIRRGGADLVVMTTHGRSGLSRAILGSVADGLVRGIHRPILLIRPAEGKAGERAARETHRFRRILVPLDESELSVRVLPYATEIARLDDAELVLFRAVPPIIPLDHATAGHGIVIDETDFEYREEAAKTELARIANGLRDQGFEVDTRVVRHVQADVAIADAVRQTGAELIAMATRGHGGVARFLLGSVADQVLRAAPAPLLVVRPPEED